MSVTYDEVKSYLEPLETLYDDYHSSRKKLRQFWHGRYWEDIERETNNVSSIFRDITARTSDIGPDIKLVYNLLKDVAVKYQTFLSPLPMIRMYVDTPASQKNRTRANTKERYLYGLWAANSMNKVLADKSWYLPLMGDAFLGIFPDFQNSICRTFLRSPEFAYPLPSWDNEGNDGIVFKWKTSSSAARRAFPQWSGEIRGRARRNMRRGKNSDPQVEIIEFFDDKEFCRFIEGERVGGIEHNYGFNLVDHVKFINVPGETFGHGAVEQSVNLVEMGNAYLSLMMQSAIENVFPVMVLEDAMKAPSEIERGAGAVIPVNAGGKVYYLTPPAGNLLAQGEWAQQVERMVKTDTSMPDVNFGQAENSIITGKAINELQGAGTGSLVEMVQGIGIGAALVSWNEKAIHIGRTAFKDDRVKLYGQETPSLPSTNAKSFTMSIKGSELVGSARNDVVFMPHIDMHTKVVIGLQMAGAGLVSREWQRNNVGIPDSAAMDDEIVGEVLQDAVLKMIVTAITDPASMESAETQAIDVIEGHPLTTMREPPMPGAPPLGVGGTSAPGPGDGGPATAAGGPPVAPLPGGGQIQAAPFPQPPGSPVPAGAPQPSPQQGGQGIPLDQAVSAFQSLPVHGRVFLVGEIVARGSTTPPLEVRITDPADRDVIAQAGIPVEVRVIPAEPQEPYIEVTPGASPVIQGTDHTEGG